MPYLILIGDLLVVEVGDGHLVVGGLSDLVFRSLGGSPGVQEVAQRLVVYFDKACSELELRKAEQHLDFNVLSKRLLLNTELTPFSASHHVLTSQPCASSFSAVLKICCTARGMTPLLSVNSSPSIVYVFPLPVWPYAKQQTL